ncbi:MAG: hypothetical protein IPF56_20065 [Chloroflexi bacterium]|nr:hypothetical protein [Chloroflexota bacterium]MBK6710034.1 hypothetical protein [Chloroflexota bacterium]MBK7180798.1 hypothetical protein [Chloroflexota bacterium]
MKIVSLNGRWQFKQAAPTHTNWLAATVPGCVHTHSLAAGAIQQALAVYSLVDTYRPERASHEKTHPALR